MQKKKKYTIIFLITILVLVILFGSYIVFVSSGYIYNWDGGKWQKTINLPSSKKNLDNLVFIEYNNTLYCFGQYTSKSTYTGGDCITPEQYSLSDIFLIEYSNKSWHNEKMLSNSNDETSEGIIDALVYQNEIFVTRAISTRYVINNDDSKWDNIKWNTSILLQSYNGDKWKNHGKIILSSDETPNMGSPCLNIWNNKILAFWKTNQYYEENHYAFKFYDGTQWSSTFNMTMPTIKTNDLMFHYFNNKLYAIWQSSVSGYFDLADIYLGYFNGTTIVKYSKMTDGTENQYVCRPHITDFDGKIYVSWESKKGIYCRSFNNGTMGDAMCIGSGLEVFSVKHNNKLYLLYQCYYGLDGDPEFIIKSYDGKKWSESYQISSSEFPASDDPRGVSYDKELLTYWTYYKNSGRNVAIRCFFL